jgi:enamine deaminase RidA (YjgF/YER057c/UK114 family)
MRHVVYTQVYLSDPTDEGPLNELYKEFFPTEPPARSTVGIVRLPGGTPVEISAVAYRNLAERRSVVPPNYPKGFPISAGVLTRDRFYLSGFLGRDINTSRIPDDPAAQVELSLKRVEATLAAAGLDFRHLVFTTAYLTPRISQEALNSVYARRSSPGNAPARAVVRLEALPSRAGVEFTGVAVRNLADRRVVRPRNLAPSAVASPCVFAGDTLYCSAKPGFTPGPREGIYAPTVGTQVRQSMRNLLDGLEESGLDFSRVVASYVYLDTMDEFAAMNRVYAQYFSGAFPARTTLQPAVPVERKAGEEETWPQLEQIVIIAVK